MGVVEKCYIFRREIGYATREGHLHRILFRLFTHPHPPPPFSPVESLSHRLLLDHPRGSQSGQQNVCGESYCKIDLTEHFHHKHSIVLTSCPWVSEDAPSQTDVQCQECPSQNQRKLTENIRFFSGLCLQPELKRNKYYGISQNNIQVTFQWK